MYVCGCCVSVCVCVRVCVCVCVSEGMPVCVTGDIQGHCVLQFCLLSGVPAAAHEAGPVQEHRG